MLLGGHGEISALGEIHRFYLSLHKDSRPHRCDCGQAVLDCSFWSDVIERLIDVTGQSRKELLESFVTTNPAYLAIPDNNVVLAEEATPARYQLDIGRIISGAAPLWMYRVSSVFLPAVREYQRYARNSLLLFDAVREVAGTPIIVDSTKNPVRLRTLFAERPEDFTIIYLVRDGRAVTHSRMTRHGISMRDAAKIWVAEHNKQKLAQRSIPSERILRVRYEDLCLSTEATLKEVCVFLGVEYSDSLLTFRDVDRHAVGGNPMRFNEGERKIELREWWREDLVKADLDEFESVAGKMNRLLGYR